MKTAAALASVLVALVCAGDVRLGDTEFTSAYLGTTEITSIHIGETEIFGSAPTYEFTRTLDRTFTGGGVSFPTWGGGNVNNNAAGNRRADFVHGGMDWEMWQVVPFDGPGIGGTLGAARVQLRNRDVGRGANTLEMMPTKITLSGADWTGLPWTFTRTTNAADFDNVASGNSARKAVTYVADRTIASDATPAGVGIAQGESFTITLEFGQ